MLRRLAGDDPAVNEEWNCDKGRWAFAYASLPTASPTRWCATTTASCASRRWPEALEVAAARACAPRRGGVGVLVGGRVTHEDAYAYAKFARVVLGTNDVDFRARPHSAEEADFLASHVVAPAPTAAR